MADPETLDSAVASFNEQGALIETFADLRGLADLNDALTDHLKAGLEGGTSIPADAADIESRSTMQVVAGDNPQLASGGYLTTRDGNMLFLLVSPSLRDDS